jgi:hypothetical protein
MVERLKAASLYEVNVSVLARSFAAYVRERKTDRDVISFVLALRMHGDAWLLRFIREQKTLRIQEEEAAKTKHRQRYEAEWLAFIAQSELSCRSTKREAYSAFARRFADSKWRLSGTDSERARLLEFRNSFGLPDFWQWDAEFNPSRFRAPEERDRR